MRGFNQSLIMAGKNDNHSFIHLFSKTLIHIICEQESKTTSRSHRAHRLLWLSYCDKNKCTTIKHSQHVLSSYSLVKTQHHLLFIYSSHSVLMPAFNPPSFFSLTFLTFFGFSMSEALPFLKDLGPTMGVYKTEVTLTE